MTSAGSGATTRDFERSVGVGEQKASESGGKHDCQQKGGTLVKITGREN
jgi:hypothetical protein